MIKRCATCGREFDAPRSTRRYCSYACSNKSIAQTREDKKVSGPVVNVWSCGGGVQSSAIAALIIQGRLPKPDYAVIMDVGYEKSTTWDNVYGYLVPALAAAGVTLHILKTTDYRDNDLFDRRGYLVLPAYHRDADGTVGKLPTHCSAAWKRNLVMRWLRKQGVTHARNWLGISAEERHRIRPSPAKWYSLWYPLAEMGLDRLACHKILWEQGWDHVVHSSCYICPQQPSEQWVTLYAKHRDDWQRAVAIDEWLRRRGAYYLHRSGQPLAEWIETQKDQGWPILREPCETPCVECG